MIRTSNDYSFSLFGLAKEQGRIGEYKASLETVRQILEEYPNWLSLLFTPAIPMEERVNMIDSAFGSLEVREVLSFLKLLCEKGKIRLLPECIEDFFRLEKESQNRISVEVRFASPLKEEQKSRLEEKLAKLTGKIPEITYSEDPSLIGGIRIQIEDAVLDGSLSARLGTLKGVIKG